jgi:nucleoid-associated protein YgaU
MSHPWRSEPGIALLAPVATVEQAAAAAAAGAGLVDAGDDAALVPAIRRAVSGVRVCGEHEDADLMRDTDLAARTGAALICPGADAAEAAARRGVAAGRILVQAAPAGIEAVVAVCAWLGASVLRTRHVAKVRRCADMTEAILGRRPPVWAVRGLA